MNRTTSTSRILASLPILLGLSVAFGWIARLPILIQVSSDFMGMTFNTSLSFILAGFGLFAFSSPLTKTKKYILRLIGIILLLFSLLSLLQNIFEVNFGVDEVFIEHWLKDINAYPGRPPVSVAISIALVGIVYLIYPLSRYRFFAFLCQILIFTISLFGIMGLLSYLMSLELLYTWQNSLQMPILSAIGAILISAGLWRAWVNTEEHESFYSGREDTKITLLSGALLISISLAIEVSGFSIIFQHDQKRLQSSFQEILSNQVQSLKQAIEEGVREAHAIADSAVFQKNMANPNQSAGLSILEVGRFFIAQGFSSVKLSDLAGRELINLGKSIGEPDISYELPAPQKIKLMWKDGWYLGIHFQSEYRGMKTGFVSLEWPLHSLNHLFMTNQRLGKSGDTIICFRKDADTAFCFPSQLNPHGFETPLVVDGRAIPIHFALHGQMGVMTGIDHNHQKVIAAYAPVEGWGMGMSLKMNVQELYQSIREQLNIIMPVGLFLIILSMTILYWQIMPLVHKTVKSEQEALKSKKLLEESQARLLAIVDSVAEAIITLDENLKIESVNPWACRLFGYVPEEIIGEDFKILLDPREHSSFMDLVPSEKEKARVKKSFEEKLGRKKNGHSFPIELSLTKMETRGRFLYVSIIRDITERRHAEESLRNANHKLSQSLISLGKHNQENTLLRKTSSILQACLRVEEAYSPIMVACEQLFPGTAGVLYLTGRTGGYVEAVASWGQPKYQESVFGQQDCWALRRSQSYQVDDVHLNPLCVHLHTKTLEIAGYLCAPILAQGESIGLLYIETQRQDALGVSPQTYFRDVQELASTFVEQIGLALANIRLRETLRHQSIRDPLTGLYNRRYLDEALKQEVSRAARAGYPLSFIMLDIDHFKTINDTYGHDSGDSILIDLAELLEKRTREGDIIVRYGGEEFLILLPNASISIASDKAEKIREDVKKLEFKNNSRLLKNITVSLGVASFPAHGNTVDDVIIAADKALYAAKNGGRDRVVVYDRQMS